MTRRILWFVVLWLAGVLTVGGMAMLIRLILRSVLTQ